MNRKRSSFGHLLLGKICTLAFSPDGMSLLAVGNDSNHSISLIKGKSQWISYARAMHCISTRNEVYTSAWLNPTSFYTAGEKHVYFWTVDDEKPVHCTFGSCPLATVLCCVVYGELLLCGTTSGNVITFQGTSVLRHTKIHKKSVNSITLHKDGYFTAGGDRALLYWNNEGKPLYGFNLKLVVPLIKGVEKIKLGRVTAVVSNDNVITVGDSNNNVFQVTVDEKKLSSATLLIHQGQYKYQVVSCKPSNLNSDIFCTIAIDQTLYVWDLTTKLPKSVIKLPGVPTVFDFHPKLNVVAVAIAPEKSEEADATEEEGEEKQENEEGIEDVELTDGGRFVFIDVIKKTTFYTSPFVSRKRITNIKFSPNGKTVSCVCKDNKLYSYDVSTPEVKYYGSYGDGSSEIKGFDFSKDSRILKVQFEDETIQYIQVENSKQYLLAKDVNNKEFDGNTIIKSYNTRGLLNTKKGYEIRCCTANPDCTLLLLVDNTDSVKLYRYPVYENSSLYKSYAGQSCNVNSGHFMAGGKGVLTYSRSEGTIFVWGYQNTPETL